MGSRFNLLRGTMISIIAAIGKNNEMGVNNKLPFHCSEDLQFFKETTLDKLVIMGYNTWKSIPNGLPHRDIIVVTNKHKQKPIYGSDNYVTEFMDMNQVKYVLENTTQDVFIAGGLSIYNQLHTYADNMIITHINKTNDKANVFFPIEEYPFTTQSVSKTLSEDAIVHYYKKV